MRTVLLSSIFSLVLAISVQSQDVELINPSFEGQVNMGGNALYFDLEGWTDCGYTKFRGETPPDIHPGNFWNNAKTGKGIDMPASDGNTYVGMVVRKNSTYESISQHLNTPLVEDQCYVFSLDLMRSQNYWSLLSGGGDTLNFTTPIVLRIWGSNTLCYLPGGDVPELLAVSSPVANTDWQTNIFNIKPRKSYSFITLEAFYKTPLPNLEAYVGHILVDHASTFVAVDCEDKNAIVSLYSKEKKIPTEPNAGSNTKEEPKTQTKQNAGNTSNVKPKENPVVAAKLPPETKPSQETKPTAKPKEKILKDLDKKKLVLGQKIKIEKLYFEADTAFISDESYEVLDEIVEFLKENDNIAIEIGGHTNGIPSHQYCDKLSAARAKLVSEYIISKGISPDNVAFKGYGKRQPVASNNSDNGRKLNQRVEIKILRLS